MPQADNNVPFTGPRSRYIYVGVEPLAQVHSMALATAMDGNPAATASLDETQLDPVISSGQALWANLTHGGFFGFQGLAVTIESLGGSNGTLTWQVTDFNGNVLRPTPQTPFNMSPNEYLMVTGSPANPAYHLIARVVARMVGERVL